MGNQIAIKLHTSPGQEVVVEERGHVYLYEMAAMAAISGCLARPVAGVRGRLEWPQVEAVLSPPLYYRARTGLLVLENTHNMAGGTVLSAAATRQMVDKAHARGLPVHLDGARIFNAAVAAEVPVSELADGCDSVMFCFSKGLCAPVGSMLVGSLDFIQEARRVRKMLGGGMRQAGVLAAAALVALEQMPARLHEDHANARLLAEALAETGRFMIDPTLVETNILIADLTTSSSAELLARLKEQGVLAGATGTRQVRFVTHRDVSRKDVVTAARVIRRLVC
jgi:threonine aldolase